MKMVPMRFAAVGVFSLLMLMAISSDMGRTQQRQQKTTVLASAKTEVVTVPKPPSPDAVKPVEAKAEAVSAEAKPAGAKAAEAKPAEAQAEAKPATEAKPAKPEEAKAAEPLSVEDAVQKATQQALLMGAEAKAHKVELRVSINIHKNEETAHVEKATVEIPVSKAAEAKPAEAKAKPAEPVAEANAADAKPAEAKAKPAVAEANAADAKPAEAKPVAEAKAAEAKAVEPAAKEATVQAEAKPAEAKEAEAAPATEAKAAKPVKLAAEPKTEARKTGTSLFTYLLMATLVGVVALVAVKNRRPGYLPEEMEEHLESMGFEASQPEMYRRI